MKVKEFESEVFEQTIKELTFILEKKGNDYREGSDDIHANFKNEAEKNDVSPYLILSIYMNKHLSAIQTYIKSKVHNKDYEVSEPIEGRILDSINYLMLLLGMVKDENKGEK